MNSLSAQTRAYGSKVESWFSSCSAACIKASRLSGTFVPRTSSYLLTFLPVPSAPCPPAALGPYPAAASILETSGTLGLSEKRLFLVAAGFELVAGTGSDGIAVGGLSISINMVE